jgi:hypothetical protein
MSSDLVKRLREAEVGEAFQTEDGSPELQRTALGQEAAERIEALEGEVERLASALEGADQDVQERLLKAIARAERLRVALGKIASGRHSGLLLLSYPPQDPAVVLARKALEDDKQ